jgi:ATP-binding cassette, subfamily F, member 3
VPTFTPIFNVMMEMDSLETKTYTKQQANIILREELPTLDDDLRDYSVGYLADPSSDFSLEALIDFLGPLLQETEITAEQLEALCSKFAVAMPENTKERLLELPMGIHSKLAAMPAANETKAKIDIRHGFSTRGPANTTVDSKKLRKAEMKIEAKRHARGAMDLYEGQVVPEWNPEKRPDIVVNQMKSTMVSDSRSKDIKLENFDIHFAGNKILTNANLLLAYGRRYGLVGKNGIGKSTLLRAIAHKELLVPSHLRILHVEQEIAGDDKSALQSVLDADEERVALVEKEIKLNADLNKTTLTLEEAASIGEELKHVYRMLEDIEADKAESKASAILSGLGFSSVQQQAATKTFSGGWRMVY